MSYRLRAKLRLAELYLTFEVGRRGGHSTPGNERNAGLEMSFWKRKMSIVHKSGSSFLLHSSIFP